MIIRICFPFFDTRFARAYAAHGHYQHAPRWLVADPPPPLSAVGGMGAITRHIPPPPYASAEASNLIKLYDIEQAADAELRDRSIDMVAGQHGHARLRVTLETVPDRWRDRTLDDVIEGVLATEVAVRHPERRGIYEPLGEAGPFLADLYARESARTLPESMRRYEPDLVRPGRPFLLIVNTRRETLAETGAMFRVPVTQRGFEGEAWFYAWHSALGGDSLPVWYVDAPRGGEAWRHPAEALEDLTAVHEELFLCLVASSELDGREDAKGLRAVLERYAKKLSGQLRKGERHGVNLQVAMRLLSDYDTSALQPREGADFNAALLDRVQSQISEKTRVSLGEVFFRNGSIQMNVTNNYTGNVINYGVMRDNTITLTNTMIDGADKASAELKDKLKELREPLLEAAKELSDAEAKALMKDYETFTEQALRETPPKAVVEAQGNHIVETVKKVAAFATPVATIVGAILKIIAG